MSDSSQTPANSNIEATEQPDRSAQNPSPFAGLSNTELAVVRTDLASDRTDMAQVRTDLARERTRAAQERTMMAWIRTSLSMISFGFGIDRFFQYLKKTQTGTFINQLSEERLLGLSLITLGTFALGAAIIGHWQTLRNIDQRKFKYIPNWSLGLTVGIVLFFIGLATFIPLLLEDIKVMELVSLDSQLIQNLASLTVFLIMLTLGLDLPLPELFAFWKKPGLLGRSLLATIVIPPIAIALTLLAFNLPESFTIALVILAAAPGPPLLIRRAAMAGGRFEYTASLQITLSLLAVGVTPLIVALFHRLFPEVSQTIHPLQVAKQIALVQFLPISIGLAIRQIWSELADEIGTFLTTTANILFTVQGIFLLVLSLDLIPSVGLLPILVSIPLVAIGLTMGHLLGGDDPGIQATLATATIARNVGLAIFIAVLNQRSEVIPSIIAALVLGVLFALPYSVWMKRKIAQSQAEPIDASAVSS